MCFLAAIALLCQMVVGSKIIREKMIIIEGLGVQIESYNLRGQVKKRFIDIGRIRDIVINEVRKPSIIGFDIVSDDF